MSRIRDIASILTSASVLSTDVETSAAITAAINALPPGYGRGNTASRPVSPTVGDIYVNTQTGFIEIYESTGWSQVGAIASTVTGVTATNSPSGRAFNNGAAAITFTPGTVLGKTYVVTSSPGSYTASGTASPITITGLQSSTQYTYTVVASNNYGTASASSASSAVTATTVPQAPSVTSVTAGNAQVSVAFSANATGGSTITGYTVTSSPGNITASGATSPIVVTGLTNDTSYTFTVKATNNNGESAASSASSSATPQGQISVEYLVVAGGGAGGSNVSGGGGGGGLRTGTVILDKGVLQSITVGGGGARPANDSWTRGGNGGPSSFGSISTTGGGGGSGYGDGGAAGGSGGGAGVNGTAGAGNAGGYNPVEGYAGGIGPWGTTSNTGGGGGANGAGGSPARGPGRLVFGATYSAGGLGKEYYGSASFDQTANTGNGADGCGQGYIQTGSGGSGVVILKFLSSVTPASTSGSPQISTDGSYKLYKFTGNGGITF
jgi:hypothetical protein